MTPHSSPEKRKENLASFPPEMMRNIWKWEKEGRGKQAVSRVFLKYSPREYGE